QRGAVGAGGERRRDGRRVAGLELDRAQRREERGLREVDGGVALAERVRQEGGERAERERPGGDREEEAAQRRARQAQLGRGRGEGGVATGGACPVSCSPGRGGAGSVASAK